MLVQSWYNVSGPAGCISTPPALTITSIGVLMMADDSLPKTHAAAKAAGATYYFTGKPCKRGHIAKRLTKGGCVLCASERANEIKEWRRVVAGPDALYYSTREPCARGHIAPRLISSNVCVECRQENYLANADVLRRRSREDYAANRPRRAAANAAWAARNPDKVIESSRRLVDRINADPGRREAVRQRHKEWRQTNPERIAAWVRRRQAAQLQRTPAWLTADDHAAILEVYAEAARLTRETGIPHEVDHIVPLRGKTVSGLHVPANLQILTASANRSKGHKHAD